MDNNCCVNEIQPLKDEKEKLLSRIKELKEEYKNCLIQNLQKDVTIQKLKHELNLQKYSGLEGKVSKTCLSSLRSLGLSKKDDAVFVSVLLHEIYKDGDVNVLAMKSLSGRSKNGEKTELTPEKKTLLENAYTERMSLLPAFESVSRKEHLSKLIRNVIDVAARKKQ